MKEIWKPVPGFKNSYAVSNLGRVKSLERSITFTSKGKTRSYFIEERLITPRRKGKGKQNGHEYHSVAIGLRPTGTRNELLMHRLVAKTFIPNPGKKPQVNHKNGKKDDNRATNLEWVTEKENMQHAIKAGLIKKKKK